jgi:hypothetical protein
LLENFHQIQYPLLMFKFNKWLYVLFISSSIKVCYIRAERVALVHQYLSWEIWLYPVLCELDVFFGGGSIIQHCDNWSPKGHLVIARLAYLGTRCRDGVHLEVRVIGVRLHMWSDCARFWLSFGISGNDRALGEENALKGICQYSGVRWTWMG